MQEKNACFLRSKRVLTELLTLESDFQKLAWRLNARWAKRSTTWGSPNQTIQRGLFLPLTTLASLQLYYKVLFLQNCCCSGRQIVFRRGLAWRDTLLLVPRGSESWNFWMNTTKVKLVKMFQLPFLLILFPFGRKPIDDWSSGQLCEEQPKDGFGSYSCTINKPCLVMVAKVKKMEDTRHLKLRAITPWKSMGQWDYETSL